MRHHVSNPRVKRLVLSFVVEQLPLEPKVRSWQEKFISSLQRFCTEIRTEMNLSCRLQNKTLLLVFKHVCLSRGKKYQRVFTKDELLSTSLLLLQMILLVMLK